MIRILSMFNIDSFELKKKFWFGLINTAFLSLALFWLSIISPKLTGAFACNSDKHNLRTETLKQQYQLVST